MWGSREGQMEMIVYLDSTTVLMNVSQKHWACGGN